MNSSAQVGQWYMQLDTRETFLVTGYDDKSRMIETQAINGDLDEIDEENWNTLPLAFAEPPEDWTEAIDDADVLNADCLKTSIEGIMSPEP
jgi:uncharacterized protein DUF6763